MKVALYARVSTDDQHVRRQLEKLRKYAQAQGWNIVREIADEESGRLSLLERRRFKKLLDELVVQAARPEV